jgi:hypothetical protein
MGSLAGTGTKRWWCAEWPPTLPAELAPTKRSFFFATQKSIARISFRFSCGLVGS